MANRIISDLIGTFRSFFSSQGGFEGKEIVTPSNPSSGKRRIYPKTDGWYDLDDAGSELKLIGADVTTANITDSTDKRYCTDAQKVFLVNVADVQLQYTDANTVTLAGIKSNYIWVNTEAIDISSSKTIDTDSASHFIISGTTTVSKSTALNSYTGNGSDGVAYNAYGLHHIYVCNSNAVWNFASYDRRGSIILSASAPTAAGYLAASGDGLNARHVGWICCNTSRQFPNLLCVSSRFNRVPQTYRLVGATGGATSLTPDSGVQDLPNSDCQFYVISPEFGEVDIDVELKVRNYDADVATMYCYIYVNTTAIVSKNETLGDATGRRREAVLDTFWVDGPVTTTVGLWKLMINPTLSQPNSTPQVVCSQSALRVVVR